MAAGARVDALQQFNAISSAQPWHAPVRGLARARASYNGSATKNVMKRALSLWIFCLMASGACAWACCAAPVGALSASAAAAFGASD